MPAAATNPAAKPTVVIHTNDQQMVAALVSAHSLKSRSRNPHLFEVRLLRLEETPHLYKRHNETFFWWEGAQPTSGAGTICRRLLRSVVWSRHSSASRDGRW